MGMQISIWRGSRSSSEREADSVISSVETEVSKYELATDLLILVSDSDLDMEDGICEVG